jgi:hypothetical protein
MDDLDRFFRQIVHNLAAIDPGRLQHPLPIGEIRHTILPYRANRRALQLESSEDYELVLIRLCAGEGGFARTEPDDVHAAFAAEALSSNPDLTIVHRHENAVVILTKEQIARALRPASDLAFAPPDQRFASRPAEEPISAPDLPLLQPPAICPACGGDLPRDRSVKFCPECGESQAPSHCPQCHTKLEPAWRHCVTCGSAITGAG